MKKLIALLFCLLVILPGCSKYEKKPPKNSAVPGQITENATPAATTSSNKDLEELLEDAIKEKNLPVQAIGLENPKEHMTKVFQGELGKITIDADVFVPTGECYHYDLKKYEFNMEEVLSIFFEGGTPSTNHNSSYFIYEMNQKGIYYKLMKGRSENGFTFLKLPDNKTADLEFYQKISTEEAAKAAIDVLEMLNIEVSPYYIVKNIEDLAGLPAYEFTFYPQRGNVRATDKLYDMSKTSPRSTEGENIWVKYSQNGVSYVGIGSYREVTNTGETYKMDDLYTVEEACEFLQEELDLWGFDYDKTFRMVSLIYAPTQEKGSKEVDGIYSLFWEFSPEETSDQVERYIVDATTGRVFYH